MTPPALAPAQQRTTSPGRREAEASVLLAAIDDPRMRQRLFRRHEFAEFHVPIHREVFRDIAAAASLGGLNPTDVTNLKRLLGRATPYSEGDFDMTSQDSKTLRQELETENVFLDYAMICGEAADRVRAELDGLGRDFFTDPARGDVFAAIEGLRDADRETDHTAVIEALVQNRAYAPADAKRLIECIKQPDDVLREIDDALSRPPLFPPDEASEGVAT